jgi:rare lipoprotein A
MLRLSARSHLARDETKLRSASSYLDVGVRMRHYPIGIFAAVLAAALSLNAQAEQAGTHTFFGMAAYYPGRGTGLTAAHKTLPFGTRVRVTAVSTGRSVVVTINDRGPFNRGRVLDLCTTAARALGMIDRGVIYIRADVP